MHSYFCSLYNTDGLLLGNLQNLHNENHEKFQHSLSQRKKSSLTSCCIVKGKISDGIKGFQSSLIMFGKVSFTVDLAYKFFKKLFISFSRIKFRQSISAFASFLSLWFSYFVEFSSAKLALLAHLNRGYSKFQFYREVRLKFRPVSVFKSSLNFCLIHDSAGEFILQIEIFYHNFNFNLCILISSYRKQM